VEYRSKVEQRDEGLQGIAQLLQGICLITGQYADAATIGNHFPPFSRELAKIADTNETIAKPIDFLIEIGPYGALIAAGMPLIMQLLANHKVIPASGMSGVVPPEVLESQMKAQMARMQAQAMMEQRAAIQEAKDAQAEYEAMMADESATTGGESPGGSR
jgi:hypothetical protein